MLNSRPVSRANGYLTKSVGFVVSPTAKDNVRQNVFNTPNQFNLKIDRLSLMNNLKGHLSEGPLTDR